MVGKGAGKSSLPSAEAIQAEAHEAAGLPAAGSPGASEQLHKLPAASKDLIRHILQADTRQRTKELVDAAWQSLE